MKKFSRTTREHLKQMARILTIALCGMLALQLIAAQWENARSANVRRAFSAYPRIGGGPERRPPLLIVALEDDTLHLSETQKNQMRHALPMPPKSSRQEATPSLIAPMRSLQAEEWALLRAVLTPGQLDMFLRHLSMMRVFRMLQRQLQTLLFSANTPTAAQTTPEFKRMTDALTAMSTMSALIMLAYCLYLPQYFQSISGKTRLQYLHILRI